MTRCIHCTRCVRFLSEIGGNNSFGMLGRSSNSEIGLYISDNLSLYFFMISISLAIKLYYFFKLFQDKLLGSHFRCD